MIEKIGSPYLVVIEISFGCHKVQHLNFLVTTRFTMTEIGLVLVAHKLNTGSLKVFLTKVGLRLT